jgi:ankyrin repeat protein
MSSNQTDAQAQHEALSIAIKNGDLQTFQNQIENFHGEIDGAQLLIEAIYNGKSDIVQYLVEVRKVDINTKDSAGMTPLHHACCEGGNPKIVKYLIDSGADIYASNCNGNTAIFNAFLSESYECVLALIEKSKSIKGPNLFNIKDINNNTVLHNIVGLLNIKFSDKMLELIMSNVDKNIINSKNSNGDTPFHLAVHDASFKFVKLLIDHGANVNVKNCDLESPLTFAVNMKNFEVIKLLIERGANVNAQDRELSTPLHRAGYSSEISKYLLSHGADIKMRNYEGHPDGYPQLSCLFDNEQDFLDHVIKRGCTLCVRPSNLEKIIEYSKSTPRLLVQLVNNTVKYHSEYIPELIERLSSNEDDKAQMFVASILRDFSDIHEYAIKERDTVRDRKLAQLNRLDIKLHLHEYLDKELKYDKLLESYAINLLSANKVPNTPELSLYEMCYINTFLNKGDSKEDIRKGVGEVKDIWNNTKTERKRMTNIKNAQKQAAAIAKELLQHNNAQQYDEVKTTKNNMRTADEMIDRNTK